MESDEEDDEGEEEEEEEGEKAWAAKEVHGRDQNNEEICSVEP